MKNIYTSVLLAVLAATIQAAPAPIPQEQCNPNPHGRSCTLVLNGAAGVTESINIPNPNFSGVSFNSGFSVSTVSIPQDGNYFQITVYGSEGSVTTVSEGQTVAVGPPQPQVSAFCEIVCPS